MIDYELQALLVEVKGMEAKNAERVERGMQLAYDEVCFYGYADRIRALAAEPDFNAKAYPLHPSKLGV
mgnify:CR=1 FL=1|tara:strand:- start:54 stop:257 length:204 start_codon:yes stop_codon:yes gene_type:complete